MCKYNTCGQDRDYSCFKRIEVEGQVNYCKPFAYRNGQFENKIYFTFLAFAYINLLVLQKEYNYVLKLLNLSYSIYHKTFNLLS